MPAEARPMGARPAAQHWEALDGLRGIAVLGVLLFHLGHPRILAGGYAAVDMFFVLSGFLITSLLINEHDRIGSVDLRRFYERRALRLLPALVVELVVVTIIVETFQPLFFTRSDTLGAIGYVVAFAGNWRWFVHPSGLGVLDPMWSLAIEEQWYIVWAPLLVALLPRIRSRQRTAWVLAVAAVVVEVTRFVAAGVGVGKNTISLSTELHCDGLLLGAALAFWLTSDTRSPRAAHRRPSGASKAASIGAVVVLATMEVSGSSTAMELAVTYTVVVLGTAAVVHDIVRRPSRLTRCLEARPLRWAGRRSYGLYIWHYPLYAVIGSLHLPGPYVRSEQQAISLVLSFPLAALSWRVIERPANQRRRAIRPAPTDTAT